MLLNDLVETSAHVTRSSGRLEKIHHLAELLRRLEPSEIEIAVNFLSGSTRQGRIGLGPSAVWRARQAAGASAPALRLGEVDETFDRIARATGSGSTAARAALLADLLRRATAQEQDFLLRLLVGELRQGALEGVLLDAVARASNVPAAEVRRAVMMAGSLPAVAKAALTGGAAGLSVYSVQLFRPVQPMLADSADDVEDAILRLGAPIFDFKLDGARIQLHKAGDDVRVFSRQLRDVTNAVPEVVELARKWAPREMILDGEVLALGEDGSPLPFQVTMSRFGRKLDVETLRATLPLTAFFFDALYLDGSSIIDEPLEARGGHLVRAVPADFVVPRRAAGSAEDANLFLADALRRGHEGLVAKAPAAPYAAGRRGQSWLKVKVARTLDLVILAAEWGHGRRRGWLSNLHLGARDPEGGGFVMLGKTFKGLTDEMLAWQTEKLQSMAVAQDDYTVYVRPELVVEVAFNEIQESTQYPGGLALRFARVKRYRPDKAATDTDTIATVRKLHR